MYQNIYIERKYDPYEVIIHIWDDELGYKTFPYVKYAYKLSPTGGYRNIFDQTVEKVQWWKREDEEAGYIFESDINPAIRTLVDLYYESDEPSSRTVMPFDIEVESKNGLPDIHNPLDKITAISFKNPHNSLFYIYVLDEKNNLTDISNGDSVVRRFSSENALLNNFIDILTEINPTILTGWNIIPNNDQKLRISGFDVPYLYNRCLKLFGRKRADNLSPINIVSYDDYRERHFIAGRSCLDYLALYKTFTYSEQPSYTLDNIGKAVVGRGKVEYDGDLNTLFQSDINKFIEYSLEDTRLIDDIDKKTNFIDLAIGVCHKGHVPYEDIYNSSRWIDGAIFTYLKKQNIVAPNINRDKSKPYGSGNKATGAFVKEPTPGRYEWLFDLDYTSLYPSIINSLNISPDTKIGKISNEWNPELHLNDKTIQYIIDVNGRTVTMLGEQLDAWLNANNLAVSINGVFFRKDKVGIIPTMVDEWFKSKNDQDKLMKYYGNQMQSDDSKEVKDQYLYYKARRNISKVMLNSIFGVLGLSTFRYYDIDNFEAVTVTGQHIVKFAQKMTNHYYAEKTGENKDYCIYMDTDSIFFPILPILKLNKTLELSKENIIKHGSIVCKDIQDYLNQLFDVYSKKFLNVEKHSFNIKQEIIGSSGFWTSKKKRYAIKVVIDNGVPVDDVVIKGMDIVRSDFPVAFKSILKDVLLDILDYKDKNEINKKLLDFRKSLKNIIIEDLTKPTGVRNIENYETKTNTKRIFGNWGKGTPIHVKAAISYNEFLRYYKLTEHAQIYSGDKIRWVYLKTNPLNISQIAIKGYDDPNLLLSYIEKYIDREKIFDNILNNKLLMFYESLSWELPTVDSAMSETVFQF